MATNRIDILDVALLRPGRIDRKIEFPNPNESSRLDILKIHSRKMNLVRGIDLRSVADKMTGASGAELKVIMTFFLDMPVSLSFLQAACPDTSYGTHNWRHAIQSAWCMSSCVCLLSLPRSRVPVVP